MIEFFGESKDDLIHPLHKEWLKEAVTTKGYSIRKVSYTLLRNNEIQAINKKSLGHNYPTDVITFDHSRSRRLNVEVYLGVDVIESNSIDLGVSFTDEFDRVFIHALLHCMGQNDKSDIERSKMRESENELLILRPEKLRTRKGSTWNNRHGE